MDVKSKREYIKLVKRRYSELFEAIINSKVDDEPLRSGDFCTEDIKNIHLEYSKILRISNSKPIAIEPFGAHLLGVTRSIKAEGISWLTLVIDFRIQSRTDKDLGITINNGAKRKREVIIRGKEEEETIEKKSKGDTTTEVEVKGKEKKESKLVLSQEMDAVSTAFCMKKALKSCEGPINLLVTFCKGESNEQVVKEKATEVVTSTLAHFIDKDIFGLCDEALYRLSAYPRESNRGAQKLRYLIEFLVFVYVKTLKIKGMNKNNLNRALLYAADNSNTRFKAYSYLEWLPARDDENKELLTSIFSKRGQSLDFISLLAEFDGEAMQAYVDIPGINVKQIRGYHYHNFDCNWKFVNFNKDTRKALAKVFGLKSDNLTAMVYDRATSIEYLSLKIYNST